MRLLDLWSAPDGAGAPVACLASTFTFDADFFAQDCLARFLSLSTVAGEGDSISSVVAVLEEEDRLNETQVSVLVDRSSPSEKRNLRWDVVPVAVSGGLLHAKVAVLLWERHGRVILGSANLTAAGYRRQVELALTLELDVNCRVPRGVLDDLVTELRLMVGLAPDETGLGPKSRAMATVDLLQERIAGLNIPTQQNSEMRLAVAPARPGLSPLDRLGEVWRGTQPLKATVLSPFWDDRVPAPAINSVRNKLTGRPTSQRRLSLVAAIDPYVGLVQAPRSLAAQPGARLFAFDPPDKELRSLHAKLLIFEGHTWIAALVGSSNATQAGLGLDPMRGHHELNMWIGCPVGSPEGKRLRSLAGVGAAIQPEEEEWVAPPDEDEPVGPTLPLGFVSCLVEPGLQPQVLLVLRKDLLPDEWEVREPAGGLVQDAREWRTQGSLTQVTVLLSGDILPAYLVVRWIENAVSYQATWTANVRDRSALPPPIELRDLPASLLLAALASTRPLPVAFEQELRRLDRLNREPTKTSKLDPLDRFDDSGLLLQRTRHLSLALWRLQERLSRPTTSLDAIHWRLYGAFGPVAIVNGLVLATDTEEALPGEAHFTLAELCLTVAAADWPLICLGVEGASVRRLVDDVLTKLAELRQQLPPSSDSNLERYVDEAITAARQ